MLDSKIQNCVQHQLPLAAPLPGIHEPVHGPALPRLADDKCSRKTNEKKSTALAHKRHNNVVTTSTVAFRPSCVVIFAVGVFSFDGCPSCRFPWPSALSQGQKNQTRTRQDRGHNNFCTRLYLVSFYQMTGCFVAAMRKMFLPSKWSCLFLSSKWSYSLLLCLFRHSPGTRSKGWRNLGGIKC